MGHLSSVVPHVLHQLPRPLIRKSPALPVDKSQQLQNLPGIGQPSKRSHLHTWPGFPHNGPVSRDMQSCERQVDGRNSPAGPLPVKEHGRGTSLTGSDAQVASVAISVDKRSGYSITGFLDLAPALFHDVALPGDGGENSPVFIAQIRASKIPLNPLPRRPQATQVMSGTHFSQSKLRDKLRPGRVQDTQPLRRQNTVFLYVRTIAHSSGIFDEYPTEFAAFLLQQPVVPESGERQTRKDFFINGSFNQRACLRAPLSDHVGSPRPGAGEPVYLRVLAILQNFHGIGHHAHRPELGPSPDRRLLR